MRKSWPELDKEREEIAVTSPRFSRAELARRAGISESTMTKGIAEKRTPQRKIREQVELVLDAERHAIDGGLR